ncbi:DUF4178 domain-containing protein [Sphingomonas sp.]|uniref:DUF4178 domain-containing protein n=1 Tax=Sphingomonas sp. TaxID=28214 RepID=UPI0025F2A20E|nr:DUF4178 domain-containing protein [Sphingomonas sp.]
MTDAPIAPPAPPAPPPAPASTVHALSCPNCGGIVNVRAQGLTVSILCEHCGSTLDATSPDLQVIARANEALKTPQIPLGTRGTLDGRVWEVVGYMERTDEEIVWAEYLLFNPYEGYAFLVDDGRRLSLGIMLDRLPQSSWGSALLDGKGYSRFGQTYPVRVTFVVGEFYWRVAVGETVDETDFVRPGTMLSCEVYQTERTWTKLDLLDWGVAEKAFGIPARRREYSHPAPHEPSPYKRQLSEALIIGIVALFALLVISTFAGSEQQIGQTSTDVVLDGPEKTVVIRGLDLPNARSRIVVDADAGAIDNAWVDLDYSLTDEKTQDSVESYGLAEHYSGSDSDGPWSEGDPRPEVSLSSIPGGRYDLIVTLSAHRWNGGSSSASSTFMPNSFSNGWSSASQFSQSIPVTVTIKRGGIFGGNIVLAFLLIAVWPLIVLFKHIGFEKRRMAPVSGSGGSSDDNDDSWGDDD